MTKANPDLENMIIGQQHVKDRSLRPTTEQVASLGLVRGKNEVIYKVNSEVSGE